MLNSLKNKYKNKTIILASGSPRRQELLKSLDIPFIVQTKDVEEVYPKHLEEHEITAYLAELKIEAFNDISDDKIIITADTIVWHNGKAVMKPRDREEAIQILMSLSNTCHDVYTSVCIKSNRKLKTFSDQTKVCFKELTEEEITYYIDTYKPYDKAGAYGVQDWIGYIAITKLEGSYYNVMGFPVHKLYQELLEF